MLFIKLKYIQRIEAQMNVIKNVIFKLMSTICQNYDSSISFSTSTTFKQDSLSSFIFDKFDFLLSHNKFLPCCCCSCCKGSNHWTLSWLWHDMPRPHLHVLLVLPGETIGLLLVRHKDRWRKRERERAIWHAVLFASTRSPSFSLSLSFVRPFSVSFRNFHSFCCLLCFTALVFILFFYIFILHFALPPFVWHAKGLCTWWRWRRRRRRRLRKVAKMLNLTNSHRKTLWVRPLQAMNIKNKKESF